MRSRFFAGIGAILLSASLGLSQDTRSMIFGRVFDPSSAAVAGARVTIINTETNNSTALVTNETGYYEANLMIAGTYRLRAEAAGFKTSVRDGIDLPVSSHLQVDFNLEVGALTESVSVTAEAPLLDTNTMSSGRTINNRSIMDLPIPGGNTMVLSKLAPGVQTVDSLSDKTVRLHSNGAGSRYNTAGGVGGNEWSIDGTPDAANGRNVGYMPAPEIVQEFKVETSGFDASMGHSTGINVAMMTKNGTNLLHGNIRETHHQMLWDALPFFTKQAYYRRIAQAEAAGDKALANQIRSEPGQVPGRENNFAVTLGGPVVLPKIYNGRDRLFFFFGAAGFRVGQYRQSYNTVPTLADRQGDFSPLLNVDKVRYQIYDPLTVRADPTRATHVVRDPFAGNRIPAARVVNPMYKFYRDLLPEPNNNPADSKLEPSRNYIAYSAPYQENYNSYANRIDYRLSDRHRFFVRWSWNEWKNRDASWPYAGKSPDILAYGQIRNNFGGSADWTWTVNPSTLLDVAVAANVYRNQNYLDGAQRYKPSDVGLPAYMDAKAGDLAVLPSLSWSGYTGMAPNNSQDVSRYRFLSAKADLSHVRGTHTMRAGIDARGQFMTSRNVGNASGSFGFGNQWTKREDDSFTPAGSYGHSWAAFMMGLPDSLSVATNDDRALLNPYYAGYAQDNWRVTSRLSINLGLRLEYEMGATERYNRMLAYFDPNAKLPITGAAQAAYAGKPIAEVPASQFVVRGGSLYAGVGGAPRRLWDNALMWLPRASAAYQLNKRTVVRGGYGIFYDTLNVLNEGIDQTGFSRTTASTMSTDFGQTWLLGNPKAGISPLTDPFPVRADGTRFDAPLRDALGLMAKVGRGNWTFNPFDRKHARQQRWRVSVQRQIGTSMVLDIAYAGSYSDRINVNKVLSALPGQYWADGLTRNDTIANNLNANVTNPFSIGNFADLKASQPVIYNDMMTNSFFTSSTIRRNQLIRAFPQMNGITQGTPAGQVKTHSLEVGFERRFSKGVSLNLAYTRLSNRTADTFLNEFDPAPGWRDSNNGRPQRLTGTAICELPFGKGRRFAKTGLLSHIAGGFQFSLIYEYQPGALLDFGNLFYYGKIEDINTGTRTLDHWFNTDNFERTSSKVPASFHRRVFPTRIDGLRADMLNNWNGSAQRQFKFKERWSLQFRFDAMNLQNRSQFDAPNTSPTSTDFARVTSQPGLTGSGGGALNRWVQVQARLQF